MPTKIFLEPSKQPHKLVYKHSSFATYYRCEKCGSEFGSSIHTVDNGYCPDGILFFEIYEYEYPDMVVTCQASIDAIIWETKKLILRKLRKAKTLSKKYKRPIFVPYNWFYNASVTHHNINALEQLIDTGLIGVFTIFGEKYLQLLETKNVNTI